MIRKIIIVLVLAAIGVPSWQIGMIMIQKKNVRYKLQEQANSIKKYDNEDIVKENTAKELKLEKLPTEFEFETLERRKVKITYRYVGKATLFGHTYYTKAETIEAVTEY